MMRHRRANESSWPRRAGCTLTWIVGFVCTLVPLRSPGVEPAEPWFEVRTLRGRVVFASEALARRFQIREVPEAAERVLVLEEANGTLHPLVDDIRGRAFRRDPRFRQVEVELLVRVHPGSPFVQVIRVFERRKDGNYELDYWCEICSISMFELKECECCQGPIELRRRKVTEEEQLRFETPN